MAKGYPITSENGGLELLRGGDRGEGLEWFLRINPDGPWADGNNPGLNHQVVQEALDYDFPDGVCQIKCRDDLSTVNGLIFYMPTGFDMEIRQTILDRIEEKLMTAAKT